MKKIFIAILFIVTSVVAFAQNKTSIQKLSEKAIDAWQLGESGKGYSAFNVMLDSTNFIYFSHPFIGNKKAKQAFSTLQNLITQRTANPNNLVFSEKEFYVNGSKVVILFRSTGNAGKIQYDGPVGIQFEFKNKKIVGFKEYLGEINSSWFK
jgi:hypothetical protein